MPNENDSTGYSWAEAEAHKEEQREEYRKQKEAHLDMLTEAAVLVDIIDSRGIGIPPMSKAATGLHEILDELRKILEEVL